MAEVADAGPRPDLDAMPAALPAMWRALRRGYEAEPALLVMAAVLSLLVALPDALTALWFKFLGDVPPGAQPTLVHVAAGGLAAAVLTCVVREPATARSLCARLARAVA